MRHASSDAPSWPTKRSASSTRARSRRPMRSMSRSTPWPSFAPPGPTCRSRSTLRPWRRRGRLAGPGRRPGLADAVTLPRPDPDRSRAGGARDCRHRPGARHDARSSRTTASRRRSSSTARWASPSSRPDFRLSSGRSRRARLRPTSRATRPTSPQPSCGSSTTRWSARRGSRGPDDRVRELGWAGEADRYAAFVDRLAGDAPSASP